MSTPSDDSEPPERMMSRDGGRASSLLMSTGEFSPDVVSDIAAVEGGMGLLSRTGETSASRSCTGAGGGTMMTGGGAGVVRVGDTGGGGMGAGTFVCLTVDIEADCGICEFGGRGPPLISRIIISPPASRSIWLGGGVATSRTMMSSAVGRLTGMGIGGFVTEMVGSGCRGCDKLFRLVTFASGPLLEASLDSVRTGMGTSALDVTFETAFKVSSGSWSTACTTL